MIECPLWVKSKPLHCKRLCPLYPPKANICSARADVYYGPKADVCHSLPFRLRPRPPAFRECQRRCREGPPLALTRPGLPLGLNAVADEARAERWYQYSAYPVAPVGDLVWLRVDEQRLADIEPSERDVFAVRLDVLSPEVAGISGLRKRRLRTGD